MFCFQCQQTAKGTGCEANIGVCGKSAEVADLQDELIARAIDVSVAGHDDADTRRRIIDALFTSITNANFDAEAIKRRIGELGPAGEASHAARDDKKTNTKMADIWTADPDVRSLKSLTLFGLKGIAAYAHHAAALGRESEEVSGFFTKALKKIGTCSDAGELLDLALETGKTNFACMELLDAANTGAYGTPAPAEVTTDIEPGPFIIVTGHDLRDLRMLLEQTEGKGVNVYTHCEMLPAHGYPELKRFAHLKGNFGTAWQNQKREFDGVPAPILFTSNCLVPPKESYADRVFTTAVTGYPGMAYIAAAPDGSKDFAQIIAKAKELGGYKEKKSMPGINGGSRLMTGFGHGAVLGVAPKIIEAVKAGAIKRFFLIGGCDAPGKNREYYTEFAKLTPKDTIILTLACGKFRFNDLDLGEIGGLPRVIDMGQCNDAFSAVKVAVALADAFGCGVNDLPLSLVISWYEQKAAAILLTLLHLGIKNICLGPTLPAFVSPNILNALVEKWGVHPITTPAEDLKRMMGE